MHLSFCTGGVLDDWCLCTVYTKPSLVLHDAVMQATPTFNSICTYHMSVGDGYPEEVPS